MVRTIGADHGHLQQGQEDRSCTVARTEPEVCDVQAIGPLEAWRPACESDLVPECLEDSVRRGLKDAAVRRDWL